MTSREAKRKAAAFVKEYHIQTASYKELKAAATAQGYTIVEFHHVVNDDPTAALIDALNLSDETARMRGFTFADRSHRIVFLHEDLSEAEKRVVLAHEIGHIYCGHMSSVPIIGKDVQEEYEANEFSHFLLNQRLADKTKSAIRKHKKGVGIAAACAAAIIAGTIALALVQREKRYYGEYYVTASGNKYHEAKCIFVKDKTNVHRMTIEEFESGDYEPCAICLPPNGSEPDHTEN